MAEKLDAKRIEHERKQKSASRKEEVRKRMNATFESNRRGERKVTYIPPIKQENMSENINLIKTAAYIRVSTQEELQLGSFEMQKQHYRRLIADHPHYEIAGLYCDEGISGTQIHNRAGFLKMIEDAKAGKIQQIITKSISRFGRNILDILSSLETLENLNPPVSVIFEMEGIDTSDGKSKLIISILSALAELESQQKSEAIKAGIRWRMQEGIYKFSVSNTLGYYRDYAGTVKIEPAEAEIVRYIYESFTDGVSPASIAFALTNQGIKSPKGMLQWKSSTIKSILSNEKYCGDVLYQKTYTKDFLTHKSAKNKNFLAQYHWENCHPAIVKRKVWEDTQILLREKKWGKRLSKPKDMEKRFVVAKVKSGSLRGYYLIDGSWNKKERDQFISVIHSLNELDSL